MVNCPVCDAAMDVEEDELDEGDEFTCDECGAEVAVVGTDPLEIEPLTTPTKTRKRTTMMISMRTKKTRTMTKRKKSDEDWK